MKRIIALLLCFVLAANFGIVHVSAEEATSGTWGQLTWVLDEDGTLTISGEGEMDEAYHPSPCDGSVWNYERVKALVIGEGITSISDCAFADLSAMTTVSLPNSLTKIGYSAFQNCEALTSVSIPESVELIDNQIFYNCSSLTEISIPKNVTKIGIKVFTGCSKLTKISVDENNPVYYSEGNCLIEIETKKLLSGCNTSVIPDGVISIGDAAFEACEEFTEFVIPEGVEIIENSVFRECTNLKSITIPDTVTEIQSYAFENCRSLKEVELPNKLKVISTYLFLYCENLTAVTIPNSVIKIEPFAFANCNNLNTLIIPEGVKILERSAFAWCEGITEITIPKTVTDIGHSLFEECSNLMKIRVDKDNPIYRSEGNCIIEIASNTLIEGCNGSVIPYGVTAMDYDAFNYRRYIKRINIPNTVTSLGNYDCFRYCTYLEEVVIPTSITKIYANSFDGCTNLKTVYYTGTEEQWNSMVFEENPFYPGRNTLVDDDITIVFNYTLPKGDANGDLAVDNLDASTVLKYDAGIKDLIDEATADYNGDGVVDNLDATLILKYDAGLI